MPTTNSDFHDWLISQGYEKGYDSLVWLKEGKALTGDKLNDKFKEWQKK